MNKSGAQFLHERDPNLQKSAEVNAVVDFLNQNGEKIPNNPQERVEAHLGFLASIEYANDGILTGDQASINRQVKAAIIEVTPENAQAFAKFESKIASEEGIHLDPDALSDKVKMRRLEILNKDQRKQLGEWVDYLNDKDTKYPDWFKYYSFEGIAELTKFDEEKQAFGKRSTKSFALYPELDRESLAVVYDVVKRKLAGSNLEDYTAKMQEAAQSGNFAKLYAEANKLGFAITPELKQNLNGAWRHYTASSEVADSDILADDIVRYRTGWCTAGRETAHTQLSGGDFYIFYTEDKHGRKNVPRVAVRMEEGKVREVRGVQPKQNMEFELADSVLEKVRTLPGGEEYIGKAEDMKQLTAVYKKITANAEVELSSEELIFLYELDHQIQGFGYAADPRINEIRTKRGERDKPELTKLVPESIRAQMQTSFAAYKSVARQLGGSEKRRFRRSSEAGASQQEFEQMFASKDKEWQQRGVYEEIVELLVTDGVRFNLLATPDIEASEAQIVALAEAFGKDQPDSTFVYDNMYRKNRFSARQLSGNTGTSPIKFSLIEADLDPRLASKTVAQQRDRLAQLQVDSPKLNVHIPSLLDAVSNWYALRARGDKLADKTAFNKTFVLHFDLPELRLGGWYGLPDSCVDGGGNPRLSYSFADEQVVGRVSVR